MNIEPISIPLDTSGGFREARELSHVPTVRRPHLASIVAVVSVVCQVPLRLVCFESLRIAELAQRDISGAINDLAGSASWQFSKLTSLLTYFWLILGVVWIINADGCSECPYLLITTASMLGMSSLRIFTAFAGFRAFFTYDAAGGGEAPKVAPAQPAQIRALKLIRFIKDGQVESSQQGPTCAVCLAEYCDRDELRELPCGHRFHKNCADTWLAKSKRCPLCMGAIDAVKYRVWCPCHKRKSYHGHRD
ncbi:unnamed protein product [Prorocentrum cordatum]|uniref:RING-type E3 ubiquitin transferase n=1 Tax=Prorocentrum cordatum TaxID=2364126 RepID=A0ABN9Q880_9DINO|nr:unnamed protein product [Polarella glacialis]